MSEFLYGGNGKEQILFGLELVYRLASEACLHCINIYQYVSCVLG